MCLVLSYYTFLTFPSDLTIDLKTSNARTLVVPSQMGKTYMYACTK